MAKTQKFSEDLLLEAVVKYSEKVKTKIKATELALWSRDNMPGLEDVRDYHFTRPIKEKNEKTGKMKEHLKLCTKKINEINKSRSITASINNNTLLRSAKANAVFDLPLSIQKKLVVETRETFSKLLAKNGYLSTENEVLRKMNREQANSIEILESKIKLILKKQSVLEKQVNYLLRTTDEQSRREMLEQMGIKDGVIDINKYKKCIEKDVSEIFDIGKTLQRYHSEEILEIENKDSLILDMLNGINFDK